MADESRTNDDNLSSSVDKMLGASHHFFEAIVQEAQEGVAVYDRQLRYVFVNQYFTKAVGMDAEEIVGRRVLDVFPRLSEGEWSGYVARALAGETVETDDRQWQLPDQSAPSWIRATYGPMRSPAGEIVGVLAVIRDVTARKRADEAALELARQQAAHAEALAAERKIRRLVESIADPFLAVDADWTITYVNEMAARFWMTTTDALLGHNLWKRFPDSVRTVAHSQLCRVSEEGVPTTFELQSTINGKWVEVTAYPLNGGLSIYFRTIEERKRADEARRRYERELVSARRQAEEMERLKSSLLANMSHEIRTPLTSILLQAQVLSDELESTHRAAIDRIVRSAKRLGRTLDSVLTFAQLESGMLEPHADAIDLVAEVQQIVDELKPLADSKGLSLSVRPSGGGRDPIGLDAALVHRIVTNLVANAIKFTDTGGVTVTVSQTEDTATLQIEDTGIGISEAFVEQLFEPFKQQSTGHGRTHEGSGLGLTITKRLIEALNGEIDVQSQAGVGSRFTVRLPVRRVGDAVDDDEQPSSKVAGSHGTAAAPSAAAGPILVVDDNVDICELLELMLAPRTVHTTQSAEQGLQMAADNDYAVVLMDISLPRISGVEALHQLRDQAGDDSTPVVAMTGHALPGDRQRLLDEGFDGYVAKPFSPAALKAALDAAEGSAPPTSPPEH